MASLDDAFDGAALLDMNTSPAWGEDDIAMLDTTATEPFFDASQFLDFQDSPAAGMPFGDSTADFKFSNDPPAVLQPQNTTLLQPRSAASSSSPDSSSHDSSSDSSSSNKKRKTSSESSPAAVPDSVYMRNAAQGWIKSEQPRKKERDSVMAGASASSWADADVESINKSTQQYLTFGSNASSPRMFGGALGDHHSPNQISQVVTQSMFDSVPSVRFPPSSHLANQNPPHSPEC